MSCFDIFKFFMTPRNGNGWLHSGAVFYRLCERAEKEDASTAAKINMLRPGK
jgi:hypothetical protein